MTATPASAHSNAAMVPAAPPPMISTSVWWRTTGISRLIAIPCSTNLVSSALGDLDEGVHAGIGKLVVIDVQRQLFDLRGFQVGLEVVRERPVVLRALPRPAILAAQAVRV